MLEINVGQSAVTHKGMTTFRCLRHFRICHRSGSTLRKVMDWSNDIFHGLYNVIYNQVLTVTKTLSTLWHMGVDNLRACHCSGSTLRKVMDWSNDVFSMECSTF